MRFFQPPADVRFYAGVDLHARFLFLCVLDRDGRGCFARNLTAAPEPFLKAVQPFRDGLVVGCECMHCWYWLADACRDAAISFAIGHAWAMKAVHGSKTKCDRHDAEAIARLLRGGNFPLAYAYPKEKRTPRPAPRPAATRPPTRRVVRPRPHRPPPGQPAARRQRAQGQEPTRRRRRRRGRPLRPPPRRDPPGPARTARCDHPPPRSRHRRGGPATLPDRAGRPANQDIETSCVPFLLPGCCNWPPICASSRKRTAVLGSSWCRSSSTLTARSRPSSGSRPCSTAPMPPRPSSPRIS